MHGMSLIELAVAFLALVALPFAAGYRLRAYISARRRRRVSRHTRYSDPTASPLTTAPPVTNDLVPAPEPEETETKRPDREPLTWP